jgi:type VI secretion system secreted protein Hcp
MALNAYLKLEGKSQGQIKGSVTQSGREDSIMVIAVEHKVLSPRDAASGLPTGKRQHGPLIITKWVDKSSPLLYSALVNNESIKTFRLDFYQPNSKGTGEEEQHYTIELENATISSIALVMLNNKYPENMEQKEQENVSFTYQKITWTWQDGGLICTDDWEAPKG